MISDVLHRAEADILAHLENPTYDLVYQGRERDEIKRLVLRIAYVRRLLDNPPDPQQKLDTIPRNP